VAVPETAQLVEALRAGDPRQVGALIDHGADVRYKREHGYTAFLDAVHGRDISRDPNLLDLIDLLVASGAALNALSSYGESALRVLSYAGRFDAVDRLVAAGADAEQLRWTTLMRAVACGSLADVDREIDAGGDLEALDWWQRTAFHLALMTGDIAKIERLFERGANPDAIGRVGPPLFYAIEGHHPHVVQWLLEAGADVNQIDNSGRTALMHAVDEDDAACVGVLIEAGADVDRDVFGTALYRARSKPVVERLLAGGADPATMTDEGRRALLGLPPDADERLMTATRAEFERAPTRRFGTTNPEPMSEPFWLAMVRSGLTAYAAGVRFGLARVCPRDPVWCARRFGQSLTRLPDGRTLLIAGEHEDHYDPDFCIYNDVIVQSPGGAFAIYGYPEAVFPPTDFHTATLVGDAIIIVGSLGYPGARRPGETPVYRLDVNSLRIRQLHPRGDPPGWIYGHRAELAGGRAIRVRGGTLVTRGQKGDIHSAQPGVFLLDVDRLQWRRLPPVPEE
jgi:ankyrin repeat protein